MPCRVPPSLISLMVSEDVKYDLPVESLQILGRNLGGQKKALEEKSARSPLSLAVLIAP